MDGIGGSLSVGAGYSVGSEAPSQGLDQLIQDIRDKIQAKRGEGSQGSGGAQGAGGGESLEELLEKLKKLLEERAALEAKDPGGTSGQGRIQMGGGDSPGSIAF
ncbi:MULTISPECIES: hypothetical protein [Pseudomonas]|uniref:Type III secretion protein n=1 Tax=Pseudomonas synxantha TaxID=47883 RepID=A0A5D3GJ17_9PSED|nr:MULTISPECIES: hypothetical protein [Pseudomonas]KFF43737.1 hypothetical protein JH25_08120 [Pseudomonas sp. BRG-100]MCK3832280.1 type III secretion protein [Pseudomonas fluorescens]TYK60230.1 type III secretion protein [Pseudomonas synxantha]